MPPTWNLPVRQRLNALIERWMRNPGNMETLEEVEDVIALARVHPFELNLWKSQNAYYELSQAIAGNGAGIVNEAWLGHFRGLGQWLACRAASIARHRGLRMDEDPAA